MGSDLSVREGHLPYWQQGGSVYFVTFRSARGELPECARRQVLENVLYDNGRRYDLYSAVAMPDHVHLLFRPLQVAPGVWHDLSDIMKGIKGVSARRINQMLGTPGMVWQKESFDRIVRDEAEFVEKLGYMINNPVKAGIVEKPEDYEFLIVLRDAHR